jgi:hypothetical protein
VSSQMLLRTARKTECLYIRLSNQKIVPGVVVIGVHFCLRLWLSGLRKRPGRPELDREYDVCSVAGMDKYADRYTKVLM